MRNLCRVSGLVLMLSLPASAGLAPDSPQPAHAASPTGGSVFVCIASGVLFGASILTGNGIGAAAAVLTAIENGCL